MKRLTTFLILCSLMSIAGCGAGNFITAAPSAPDLTGNWELATQISVTGNIPTAGLLLLGSLSSQGSNISGTFRLANLPFTASCGTPLQQVVNVSGSVDSSRNVTLTSTAFSGAVLTVKLLVPPNPLPTVTTLTTANGTVAVTGGTCPLASTSVFGFQTPSVTGSFTGPLTASTYLAAPPIPTGNVSLALTQSATPQSDGQFPVTGALSFSGGGCTSSMALSGTVSGPGLTLASAPIGLFPTSTVNFLAVVNPATGDLLVLSLTYGLGPCNAGITSFSQFTGNLTKQ